MRREQGNIGLIILIVVAIAFAVWWFAKSGYKFPQQTAETPIQNSADLDTAAAELDGANLNEMDSDLEQINTDSSSF